MRRIINMAIAITLISAVGFAQAAKKEQIKEQPKIKEAVKEQLQNKEIVGTKIQNKVIVEEQAKSKVQRGAKFVDQDGDGICDNNAAKSQAKTKRGMRKGPGDGTGNKGVGPKDGTGFGAGKVSGTGTGVCDGTGPKGKRGGR